ncbi:MAG: helix-turn-helix domain-containing protein [Thermoplasmata archaeon]
MGRWAQPHRDTAALEANRLKGFSLLAEGYSQADVARRLGVTPAAVCQWKRAIDRGGRKALRAIPRPGRPTLVPRHILSSIPALYRSKERLNCRIRVNVSPIPRIIEIFEERWGVRYSQSGMSRLLRRCGVAPRRRQQQIRETERIALTRLSIPA